MKRNNIFVTYSDCLLDTTGLTNVRTFSRLRLTETLRPKKLWPFLLVLALVLVSLGQFCSKAIEPKTGSVKSGAFTATSSPIEQLVSTFDQIQNQLRNFVTDERSTLTASREEAL